jgi:hypothetical protein
LKNDQTPAGAAVFIARRLKRLFQDRLFIFECSDETQSECLQRNLFGGKSTDFSMVKTGDLCLLFNYYGSVKIIIGVFEATCNGRKNIMSEAWKGSRGWLFPHQVMAKQISRERIAIPRNNLNKFVIDPASGRVRHKIFGDLAQELLQYFAGDYAAKVGSGNQMAKYEEDYRLKFKREFHCTDGHDVRSQGEQVIDN